MSSLKDIETATVTALKAGQKDRVTVLRMFSNTVKLIAKTDAKELNREVRDDDVVVAGNRMIKQAKESLSFIPEGDARADALNTEIATINEFLPQKMDRTALSGLIEKLLVDAPEGKAAKGFVMKNLNQDHRGLFDSAMANEIVSEKVG